MIGALLLAASQFPAEIEIAPANQTFSGDWDTLGIAPDPQAPALHLLTYRNSPAQTSRAGLFTVQIGSVVVDVLIEIGAGARGAERITVMPRGSYMAVPPELALQDGETGSVQIQPAGF